ncbi:hypothetical protein EES41_06440 [Streptomyces sp. ADI95-16]|uniref:DUF2180 family protein n=2 Tax=Streptomyces TaxID=1883 RepID=UPI000F3A9055|nr:DUF2180 family protein [Streptomyces sp. ADI95-16]AYV26357.1 hypothetical protein EES41_06440 [Streptomyces sp. ADI95-16]
MNCFECRSLSRTARTAEAVCCQCGVGLCREHLRIESQELHHPAGLGKSTNRLPARRIVCPLCERAEHSD